MKRAEVDGIIMHSASQILSVYSSHGTEKVQEMPDTLYSDLVSAMNYAILIWEQRNALT